MKIGRTLENVTPARESVNPEIHHSIESGELEGCLREGEIIGQQIVATEEKAKQKQESREFLSRRIHGYCCFVSLALDQAG